MFEGQEEIVAKVATEIKALSKLEKVIQESTFFYEIEGVPGDAFDFSKKVTARSIKDGLDKVYAQISIGSNNYTHMKYSASVIIAIPKDLSQVAKILGMEYEDQEGAKEGEALFIFKIPDSVLKKGYGIHETF